jgi:hypothetical protein
MARARVDRLLRPGRVSVRFSLATLNYKKDPTSAWGKANKNLIVIVVA